MATLSSPKGTWCEPLPALPAQRNIPELLVWGFCHCQRKLSPRSCDCGSWSGKSACPGGRNCDFQRGEMSPGLRLDPAQGSDRREQVKRGEMAQGKQGDIREKVL